MTDREKMIELIQNAVGGCARHWAELIADHLLANGVTVQKWIPDFQHTLGDNKMRVTHWMPMPKPPEDGGAENA